MVRRFFFVWLSIAHSICLITQVLDISAENKQDTGSLSFFSRIVLLETCVIYSTSHHSSKYVISLTVSARLLLEEDDGEERERERENVHFKHRFGFIRFILMIIIQ